MPRLYVFAICEKVIIDGGGVASLIGLFNKITASTPTGATEIPTNAVAPKEYAVYTSWDLEPADHDKQYNQIFEILYPNGAHFGEGTTVRINMGTGKRAQSITTLNALPIGQVGVYTVRTWLENDERKVIFAPISLQFEVEVVKIPNPQQTQS